MTLLQTEKTLSLSVDSGVSDFLFVFHTPISIAVFPETGATAAVQITLDGSSAVHAGSADWLEWGKGWVTEKTMDILIYPATALRFVSVNGTSVFTITS
jgi:hypothetical protein